MYSNVTTESLLPTMAFLRERTTTKPLGGPGGRTKLPQKNVGAVACHGAAMEARETSFGHVGHVV